MERAQTKDADQPDQDQVDRDDEIQQLRHQQNQDTGDKGQQRAEREMDIHVVRFLVVVTWRPHASGKWGQPVEN